MAGPQRYPEMVTHAVDDASETRLATVLGRVLSAA
jgi:hypothetical protein